MSRCRMVGADLTSSMLPYATDSALPGPAPACDRTGAGRRPAAPVAVPVPVSGGPVAPAGQLVRGVVPDQRLAGVDALAVQLGQRALDVPPDHADGDAEDALAALEQRVDLVGRGALVDRGSVAHQRHAFQVAEAALAQVLDGGADVLQGHTGVEEALDDLQHDDVAEAVQPLAARPVGGPHTRFHQSRAGPVVQLAIGDPRRRAGGGTPVA